MAIDNQQRGGDGRKSVPASTEARAFVRQFLATCAAPGDLSLIVDSLAPHRALVAKKPGTSGRSRMEARAEATMNRVGMRRTTPMPGLWERSIAFHGWHAMSPLDPAYRGEEMAPDPQFEDAVGAQLLVAGVLHPSANTLASPGPLMVGPHALARLFDRHGARTIEDGWAALEDLYVTIRSLSEWLPARWALERIAKQDSRAILPGPRGGAWIATPFLMNIVGAGLALALLVRTYLDADLLDEAQRAALAKTAGAVVPHDADIMTAGQHFFNPIRPVPVEAALHNIYGDEIAEAEARANGGGATRH